jgi:tetratricopeptide (TPR) repeat protein
MMRSFGYEAAAGLLRQALELSEQGASGRVQPALLLELARASLASGRLADARPLFRRAAETAEQAGDAVLVGEAALGLGGVWVLEHRQVDEQEAYHALLRRAHAALRESRPDLAARLRVRLAAESVYLGTAGVADVEKSVTDVRVTGDEGALAEAMSLEHHVKLGPGYAEERLPLAEEIIRMASASGDGVLTLMGLLWRTVDLFLLGRPEAERSLVELRQRAEALSVETARLVVQQIEVMQLLRAGRFDAAEAAAEACLAAANRVGDADAAIWYGGQILALRWIQGRGAELLPLVEELARSPVIPTMNQVFPAAWAALAAEAGETDAAELALERLQSRGGLAAIPQSSTLLLTMFGVVEAAAALGDAETATEAYALLLPYASLPIIGSIGIVCFGAVDRTLGLAARTAGDLDAAVVHLERAVTANRRLGNRPLHAIALADLAATLRQRGAAGDAERAADTIAEAIAAADSLGLDARAAAWRGWPGEPAPAVVDDAGTLVRRGEHWEVAAGSERAMVPDSLGMQYLGRLLAEPGRTIAAGELAGREADGSHHEVLDERAKNAYRRRLIELRADLDEADDAADIERSARLRLELDALTDELTRLLRPGGRSRAFAGPSERARTAVQKAIRRAIDRIAVDAPELAEGLRQSVRTGLQCSYEPAAANGAAPARWVIDP